MLVLPLIGVLGLTGTACSAPAAGATAAGVTAMRATAVGTPSSAVVRAVASASAPVSSATATVAPTPAAQPGSASAGAPVTLPAAVAGAPSATLRPGNKGAQVLALQRALIALGYWCNANSVYDSTTTHAVTALQKAAGLSRNGVYGTTTAAALSKGFTPSARSTSGHVVEVDLARQIALVVDNGRVSWILDASTGSGALYRSSGGGYARAVTPKGTFTITRQVNGWRHAPLGDLWRPKYFNGGIAFHGYTSVPAYPASHGCVRLTMAEIDMVWAKNLMPLGTKVIVR